MIQIECWSQDTGRIEVIISMTLEEAFRRNHVHRLVERYASEDSSTDHVYCWKRDD